MSDVWTWDDRVKRYRSSTGQFISAKDLIGLRDVFLSNRMSFVEDLASRLAGDKINIQSWVLDMRQEIKKAYMAEYELGIGGRNMMTQADFGRVGGQLKNQYRYLQNFADDIANGKLSEKQIAMRSRMYIDSATQSYERARSASLGLPIMPAYPGDGQTRCRANCKCNWRYSKKGDMWSCYWELGIAEHCEDCVENSNRWNPLVVYGK